MNRKELTIVVIALLALAVVLHFAHYLIFHDAHHTIIYMLGDIAFLPVDILVLAVIVERVIASREKRAIQHKLNMVIGAFFSEVGQPLLKMIDQFVPNDSEIYTRLAIDLKWTDQQLQEAEKFVSAVDLKVEPDPDGFASLKEALAGHRECMVRLLENPNLIEHETFTDCLWSVFHLAEELAARESLDNLPKSDLTHLAGDTRRAYVALLAEWLRYMRHLKQDYPYLYSFAARTNPFRPDAQVEVV